MKLKELLELIPISEFVRVCTVEGTCAVGDVSEVALDLPECILGRNVNAIFLSEGNSFGDKPHIVIRLEGQHGN